jgi:long-chain fatty acid transport protein
MNKHLTISVRAALLAGCGLTLAHNGASASAFHVPEMSAAGLGLSNAIVANPDERGAFAYNPAAMGFHEGSSISLGAAFFNPNFSVDTDRNHDGIGSDWIVAPMIQGMAEVHEKWRFGFGVSAPFGLETKWAEGTFPRLSGSTPVTLPPPLPPLTLQRPNGDHPTHSKVEVVSMVPSLAYIVNENLSISAGLDYYTARETRLDSSLSQLEGDGNGWGWNLSFLYADGPWSVGASYHSAATLDIEGNVTVINDFVAITGYRRPAPVILPAEVDLDLPWRLQIGARYEVNDDVAVELDWSRTGWSRFDTLRIKQAGTGRLISTNTNKLEDTNAWRIGLTWNLKPETQLRFGYTYDETGQGDEYFSPRIADNDRHLFSLGAAQELGQGWAIEGGYMYVMFEGRSYNSLKPYRLGDEINGTSAINGKYEAHAHILGFDVRKTF